MVNYNMATQPNTRRFSCQTMRSSSLWALVLLSVTSGSPVSRAAQSVALHADGWSTAHIASELGVSQRRVQQLVAAAGSYHGRAPKHPDFESVVMYEAERHGPNYGYKMLLGALHAHHPGWSWPRRAVYDVLHRKDPEAFEARRHWALRRIGRGVYYAPYFMFSVHLDLACKLQQYGIYVAAMLDGASRMVLSLEALSDKLPVTIYDRVFAPAMARFGLPDQLITDKGSEWRVAAFACLLVAHAAGRGRGWRRAWRAVQSKRNVSRPTLHTDHGPASPLLSRPHTLTLLADCCGALQL